MTENGLASIVKTAGNQDVHVILRGGSGGPNYAEEHVSAAASAIAKKRPGSKPSIMIDCSRMCFLSHVVTAYLPFLPTIDGNSQKNHLNQPKVLSSIGAQLASGSASSQAITGVMIESHLNGGRQDVPAEGPGALKHGVSITDACVDWQMTIEMLNELNEVSLGYVGMVEQQLTSL